MRNNDGKGRPGNEGKTEDVMSATSICTTTPHDAYNKYNNNIIHNIIYYIVWLFSVC